MNKDMPTALQLLHEQKKGALTSEQLTASCLERVDNIESTVGAWSYINPDQCMAQARAADKRTQNGETGQLNGIPVGIKDIFDTYDMPTENGTTAHRNRQPEFDAVSVRRLRDAGAVIMGKTVTAELAVYAPGKTTNPHDERRTPGGSSSGSAAAVAAGMVPLAVGTQTNGSVIRPASFCGVVGYKPTFGTISRKGVIRQAPSLDQVGVFAKTVSDCTLLASVLMGRREDDNNVQVWPSIDVKIVQTITNAPLRLAYVKSPVWQEASSLCQERFLEYVNKGDMKITELVLPAICDQAVACHRTIMLREMAHNYNWFYNEHHDKLSSMLLSMLEEGRQISITAYLDAKELSEEIADVVDTVLAGYDAILTPATQAEAPLGLDSTGSPIFCTLWSLCGVPAITIPVLKGAENMPLGLQLVGGRGSDTHLLRAARLLETSQDNPVLAEGGNA